MEKLFAILEDIRPDVNFKEETKLIDDSILDSFDIISIVGDINDTFEVEIDVNDLVPENFNSAEAIWALIQSLR